MEITETITDPVCPNDTTGSIQLAISGGTQPYTINWFDGSSLDSIGGLTEGCYQVEVIDNTNCVVVKEICLVAPEKLEAGGITGPGEVEGSTNQTYAVTEHQNVVYHWNVTGGTIISGQETSMVEIEWGDEAQGTVEVYVKSSMGCASDTSTLQVMIQIVGLELDGDPGIQIYPNPVKDYLRITSDVDVETSVWDITGNRRLTTRQKEIDLTSFESGLYMIIIRNGSAQSVFRIVKQ
jgi:hypothetical protein